MLFYAADFEPYTIAAANMTAKIKLLHNSSKRT
jgi:hypothetical protein